MTTLQIDGRTALSPGLCANQRSLEIPEEADLYGWLAGSWELEVLRYGIDVADRGIKGEAHFGWVLEGRAIQDVWIMPHREDRGSVLDQFFNMYGTTLRIWDPSIHAWRITWINPVTGARDELIGRSSGSNIIQIGAHANGIPIRWTFNEITQDSFHWIGEALEQEGEAWTVEGEFRAKRCG